MTTASRDQQITTKQLICPVLAVICLAIMLMLGWLWPIMPVIAFPFNLAGLFLSGLGLTLCFAGRQQFTKTGTTLYPFNKPEKLVTDGLFRYTRNPMYMGLTIFLAGAWLVLGSLSPLAVVAAFVQIVDRRYIAYEERRLRAVFGKAYTAYQARTPRWI